MNWLDRINQALKTGKFTPEDVDLSESWKTCMISERPRTRRLGNDPDNEPLSARLKALGMDFFHAVEAQNPQKALEIRKKILSD
ncbi:MAG TPA: hypothetical protein VF910_07185 [Candidatus Bathyarchaeia archaeon]